MDARYALRGKHPMPKRLLWNKLRYVSALEAADAAAMAGGEDLRELDLLLFRCIKGQVEEGDPLIDDDG